MLFQGSARNKDNCPDQDSKTKLLAEYIIERSSRETETVIDFCDLSITPDTIIKPCKGCVSTAGGFHCHYPCDCYTADVVNPELKDYMHNASIYERMEAADGFLILSPVNWYSTTSQLKLMFDRLSCINLTITADQAVEMGINKESEKSIIAEQSKKFHHLLKNHYEGKYAAFFAHGDAGGSDYYEFAKRKDRRLPTLPQSYIDHLDSQQDEGWLADPRNVIKALVWQCRYSGIFVPEDLIVGINATSGISYSEAMEKAITNLNEFYEEGYALFLRLMNYIN